MVTQMMHFYKEWQKMPLRSMVCLMHAGKQILSFWFFFLFSILSEASPLIFIDPGHGGKNYGTYSSDRKYREKDLALTTSLFLKEILQSRGYRVLLSRQKDHFLSLEKRVVLSNRSSAQIFVSVHYNSAPSVEAKGIEVFYYKRGTYKKRTRSRRLASFVEKKMIRRTKTFSRGVKTANFFVIRNVNIPAILVEGGFMTNQWEMNRLKEKKYLYLIAQGIADGIDLYFGRSQ